MRSSPERRVNTARDWLRDSAGGAPVYPISWIGQAPDQLAQLLAEAVRRGTLRPLLATLLVVLDTLADPQQALNVGVEHPQPLLLPGAYRRLWICSFLEVEYAVYPDAEQVFVSYIRRIVPIQPLTNGNGG